MNTYVYTTLRLCLKYKQKKKFHQIRFTVFIIIDWAWLSPGFLKWGVVRCLVLTSCHTSTHCTECLHKQVMRIVTVEYFSQFVYITINLL